MTRIEKQYVDCPYTESKDYTFWKRSIAEPKLSEINPMAKVAFPLLKEDVIASAGSCFAQHISRYLSQNGYRFLTTEKPHRFVDSNLSKEFNYGVYPARFGNIYTSRQLLQTIQRAYGHFVPGIESIKSGDRVLDPFRPFIQPSGFFDQKEMELDRKAHLSAVRKMFENLDVFIFTLGLTECWENIDDGSILPICPGCGAGEFNSEKYKFKNLSASEVVEDLTEFLVLLREVNPTSKVIFTVSPVPLIATGEDEHVLSATVYSKSVLRVAAEEIKAKFDYVDYFPSYELITSNASRGQYYDKDLRSVLEVGVNHVMRCFFKSYMDLDLSDSPIRIEEEPESHLEFNQLNQMIMDVVCEEELLEELE